MARELHDFLYTVGLYPWDYPLTSKLQTTFIDGQRKEAEEAFIPYENLLKDDSFQNLITFLDSVEKKLENGVNVEINCIQISNFAVTFNPFTPQLQLFMRDV